MPRTIGNQFQQADDRLCEGRLPRRTPPSFGFWPFVIPWTSLEKKKLRSGGGYGGEKESCRDARFFDSSTFYFFHFDVLARCSDLSGLHSRTSFVGLIYSSFIFSTLVGLRATRRGD